VKCIYLFILSQAAAVLRPNKEKQKHELIAVKLGLFTILLY